MAETTVTTPYASAIPFIIGDLPGWVDEYNAQRLAAYDLYDALYENSADKMQALLRGSDEKPIYVPTAKRLINTLARYVGRGWGFAVNPAAGTAAQQTEAMAVFSRLFARERLLSQFNTGKREWLRRGDWIWYVSADPRKPEGKRISIRCIDPRTYFPITHEDDIDHLIGAMLVDEYLLDDNTTMALKVQRWLKPTHPEHPNFDPDPEAEINDETPIAYDSVIYDLADWQDVNKRKIFKTLAPLEELPGIFSLPLYHIPNDPDTGNPFGRSEISGLESIVAGINQTITDEDLALSMAGLGMYMTDSGAPVDDNNNRVNWILGPNRVVEVGAGKKFERIAGITSVTPSQTHLDYLEEMAYGTSGVNDIALGKTGSQPKSGIALAIEMQPLFDNGDQKDQLVNDRLTNMFYDLQTMWLPTYEGIDLGEVIVYSDTDTGDRLPFDREARWGELVDGYAAGIFPLAYVHKVLVAEFGYDLSSPDLQAALEEQATKSAQADPYGARTNEELKDADEDGDETAE